MKTKSVLALAIIFILQTSFSFANSSKPRGKKSANYANVTAEIKDVLDTHDFGDLKVDGGKVIVKYFIDENNRINILDIKGSNNALKDYVQKELSGREVYTSNVSMNKEVILKMNFDLHSN